MTLFYFKYDSILKIIKRIPIVFDNLFFSNKYQITLKIINGNQIFDLIFDLKL